MILLRCYLSISNLILKLFCLWLAENISRSNEPVPDGGPEKINAHAVQGIAASLSNYKKTHFDEICKLIDWKFADVLSQHYTWDIAVNEYPESIPMVAAGIAFVW